MTTPRSSEDYVDPADYFLSDNPYDLSQQDDDFDEPDDGYLDGEDLEEFRHGQAMGFYNS